MKTILGLIALAGWAVLGISQARAMNHYQADRIHLFNPAQCSRPTGPLWIIVSKGQPAPGFVNIDGPGFDQIGALLTGNIPAETEAQLRAQTPACGVIASFYKNAQPVGAWLVAPSKLGQLISILKRNG